ncbi:MAG TPA: ribbon-helix-helix protein, CopG family [Actinomycetota bacterium]|nr:ribbon-helix-helix protein, CopG family [Actinomycetota bacterium]
MRKTSVYLTEEEWEALQRTAAETGRSQSELIREGVRRVTARRPRRFRSMGMGEGTGEPVGRRAEELLAATLGPRR